MGIHWSQVRKLASWLAIGIVSTALFSPVGQFFILVADERGVYQHPNARLAAMFTWLFFLTASPWFHWLGGFVVGFAVCSWHDTTIKRRVQNRNKGQKNVVWNEKSHLRLTFDSDLQTASPLIQDGINYYYWYHFPAISIDYDLKQASHTIGYVLIFLALKEPSYTNHVCIKVVGGGILCELISSHATAAVARIMGDMRGRTFDIQFGKDPIPLP